MHLVMHLHQKPLKHTHAGSGCHNRSKQLCQVDPVWSDTSSSSSPTRLTLISPSLACKQGLVSSQWAARTECNVQYSSVANPCLPGYGLRQLSEPAKTTSVQGYNDTPGPVSPTTAHSLTVSQSASPHTPQLLQMLLVPHFCAALYALPGPHAINNLAPAIAAACYCRCPD